MFPGPPPPLPPPNWRADWRNQLPVNALPSSLPISSSTSAVLSMATMSSRTIQPRDGTIQLGGLLDYPLFSDLEFVCASGETFRSHRCLVTVRLPALLRTWELDASWHASPLLFQPTPAPIPPPPTPILRPDAHMPRPITRFPFPDNRPMPMSITRPPPGQPRNDDTPPVPIAPYPGEEEEEIYVPLSCAVDSTPPPPRELDCSTVLPNTDNMPRLPGSGSSTCTTTTTTSTRAHLIDDSENQKEADDGTDDLDQSINIQERILLPPSVTPRAFKIVLDYVYKAELVTSNLNLIFEAIETADWISLCHLIKQFDLPPPNSLYQVLNHLAGCVDRTTLFSCIRLAQENNHPGLNSACLRCFAQYYHSFTTEELDTLPADVLEIYRTHMEFAEIAAAPVPLSSVPESSPPPIPQPRILNPHMHVVTLEPHGNRNPRHCVMQ